MPDQVITNINQLTPDWLTAALSASGALRTGSVRDFDAQLIHSTNARFAAIRPAYSSDATGALPTQLLLKMCAESGDLFGTSEVHYYVRDYVDLIHAPIPRCYDAQYTPNPRRYHILTDDLSATHQDSWNINPTLAYGCAVADALARLHAHWWGVQRLASADIAIPDETAIKRYTSHIQPGLAPILAAVQDEIDPAWSATLTTIFQKHPAKMVERAKYRVGFTLMHGDVNPGNILSPLNPPGVTYLIDRQPFDWSLTAWLAAGDLAYFLVLWWDTELRRQWEMPILQHYHTRLKHYGVRDYAWEQLLYDYKLTAIQTLYTAVQWGTEDDYIATKWIWWREICRGMTAFADLGCADVMLDA